MLWIMKVLLCCVIVVGEFVVDFDVYLVVVYLVLLFEGVFVLMIWINWLCGNLWNDVEVMFDVGFDVVWIFVVLCGCV